MSPSIVNARPIGAIHGATATANTAANTAAKLPNSGFGAALERLLDAPTVAAESSGAEASDDGATKGKLRFSRHAASRLHSRGMEVPQEELTRLEDAVDKLAQRGGKESLVLLGERAYIVGVPKRTVITVMPRAEALGTVFTNIDSTYVA